MRAWLYYRLSRDEDEEMNSLQNQRQILVDYAGQNGYEIVGESFDDNVSGMTFNRKGLGKLEIAVDEGKIDVVLVKDLSRLGRHRTQTELFIDHLRQNNVKVISVTEGIDSFNENDDLLIGFKQIFNAVSLFLLCDQHCVFITGYPAGVQHEKVCYRFVFSEKRYLII